MGKVSEYWNTSATFFREVKAELLKVTFPTRQETVSNTIVVLVLTILIAAFLGFSDWALSRIVKILLKVG